MDEQLDCPVWWNGKDIVETAFCEEFMDDHRLAYDNSAFFTPEGRMTDELPMRREIYHRLKICAVKNVPHTISKSIMRERRRKVLRNVDEWSAFANLLGNLIAKYADVLDIDSLPDPIIPSEDTKINEIDNTNFKEIGKDIEKDKAA